MKTQDVHCISTAWNGYSVKKTFITMDSKTWKKIKKGARKRKPTLWARLLKILGRR